MNGVLHFMFYHYHIQNGVVTEIYTRVGDAGLLIDEGGASLHFHGHHLFEVDNPDLLVFARLPAQGYLLGISALVRARHFILAHTPQWIKDTCVLVPAAVLVCSGLTLVVFPAIFLAMAVVLFLSIAWAAAIAAMESKERLGDAIHRLPLQGSILGRLLGIEGPQLTNGVGEVVEQEPEDE